MGSEGVGEPGLPSAKPPLGMRIERVSLLTLRSVWRPNERQFFERAHGWYSALPMEERECLLCLDYEPNHRGADQGTAAAVETVLLMERSAAAREVFVAGAKVLARCCGGSRVASPSF